MANALRSEFLGASLKRTEVSQTKVAERVQTQAIFGRKSAKKAEQTASKVQSKVQKTAGKVQKQATKVQKQATKQVKKATAGGKRTKGWFGGVGGPQDLDRWYGESCFRTCCLSICKYKDDYRMIVYIAAGPSRALFLPSGLLDPSDVPSYLNGTLAGE